MESIFTENQSRLLLKFLDDNNLSKAEFWAMEQILTASMIPDKLISRACQESVFAGEAWISDFESIANGVEALTKNEIVWLINKNALKRIETFLSQFPEIIGPTDGLPDLGHIDFTLKGAALAMSLHQNVFGPTERMEIACYFETPESKPSIIGQSKEAVLSLANTIDEDRQIHVDESQVQPIGSWADRWWRIFSSGFRLTLA